MAEASEHMVKFVTLSAVQRAVIHPPEKTRMSLDCRTAKLFRGDARDQRVKLSNIHEPVGRFLPFVRKEFRIVLLAEEATPPCKAGVRPPRPLPRI